MKKIILTLILFCIQTVYIFSQHEKRIVSGTKSRTFEIKYDSLQLFDNSRNRSIPVAIYFPKMNDHFSKQEVIILSHGYNQNKPGANKEYSYLAESLASKGYFVASIQHELPTDELLPMTGNIQEVRRPNWERGVENILFTINELKKIKPELNYKHIALIGHSNGGDMSVLFAHRYPEMVEKVISLDNRRMAFPRVSKPKIYSLRSSDQIADEGVLPTEEEQKQYGITIIKLNNTIHNEMDNDANELQRKEIIDYVFDFLSE